MTVQSAKEPVDQILRLLLSCLPFLEAQSAEIEDLLVTRGVPRGIDELPPWASLYELAFVRHILSVAHVIGATEELRSLAKSPDPNLTLLREIERERDTPTEAPELAKPNLALALGGVLSMMFNMKALSAHGVPINRLLAIGAAGDDSAFIKAVRLDPTVLSGRTTSIRLARAMAERDTRFFKGILSAIRDGSIRAPRMAATKERHPQLKFCLSILEDMGELDALSESSAYELFSVCLGVYPQEGQSKDAARSLWRMISRWKRFVRAT